MLTGFTLSILQAHLIKHISSVHRYEGEKKLDGTGKSPKGGKSSVAGGSSSGLSGELSDSADSPLPGKKNEQLL